MRNVIKITKARGLLFVLLMLCTVSGYAIESATPQYDELEIRPSYHGATYYQFDSFSESNNLPWNLVDESGISTSWGPGTDAKAPQMVMVDAGQPCKLKRVKLYAPAGDAPSGETLSIAVYGTNDPDPDDEQGGPWVKLFSQENANWDSKSSVAFMAGINSDAEYRYYKIEKLASNTVTLMSDMKFVVEINQGVQPRYKTFTPDYVSGAKAAVAVDGKSDTYWKAKPNDYIVVDAKSSIKLYGFELYNTENSETQHQMQWKNYVIYGSDNLESTVWIRLKSFENRFLYTKNGVRAALNVVNSGKNYRYYKLIFRKSVQGEVGHLNELKFVCRDDNGSIEPTPDMQITRRLMNENIHQLNVNEVMVVDRDITLTGTDTYAPLKAEGDGITVIEFEKGAKLTLNAKKNSLFPGLWIPGNSMVVLRGEGSLIANGASGTEPGNGQNGGNGRWTKWVQKDKKKEEIEVRESGKGGDGGAGGSGVAAGIGGTAGKGGAGSLGASSTTTERNSYGPVNKAEEEKGAGYIMNMAGWGSKGTHSGNLIVMDNVVVVSTTGAKTITKAKGGDVGDYYEAYNNGSGHERLFTGGGGGGAGGQGALPTSAICAGGGGGGGGGNGGNSGFAIDDYYANDIASGINDHYNRLLSSRGGNGGEGATEEQNGGNGQSQILYVRYNNGDQWKKDGWNNSHRREVLDQSRGDQAKRQSNGNDGRVYCLGTAAAQSVTCGKTGVQKIGNRSYDPSIAELKSMFTGRRGEKIFNLMTNNINLQSARGSVFRNGDSKNDEIGSTLTFYSGMPIPYLLNVSIPEGDGFKGFFYTSSEGTFQAFDANGMITADFRNMIMSKVNSGYVMKSSLQKDINLYPVFTGEVSLMVNHYIKDVETQEEKLLMTVTRRAMVNNSEKVEFKVNPYVTITKDGETPDTLMCDGMRLSAVAFNTDFQPQTVALSRVDTLKTIDIRYTLRGMQYTLDDSELTTYGASFYGDYTKTNDGMRMGSTVMLPRVAFKQTGTDGAYYRLAGWQSSDQEKLLDAGATTFCMPGMAASVKPVFEKSGLIAIATKEKVEDDQRNWSDSCSVLLHPDNTLYNNSTIAMAGDEQFEKMYVNIFNPIGARLKSLTAEMTAIDGTSEIRNIELVNKESVETEDQCYFLKPTDWTKGYGEYYPIVYVTAVFEEDRKTASVKYVDNFSQSKSTRSASSDAPAVALSADGKTFYYDDAAFDVLAKAEGCSKAGSLSEFDFGYEDQIRVYVNSTEDVTISAVPNNVALPEGETSAWDLEFLTSEPMTCLRYRAHTYDDVTITIQAGSAPTAVEQVEADDPSDSPIYDINGRRVGYMHKGAVVIKSGKKYVVR